MEEAEREEEEEGEEEKGGISEGVGARGRRDRLGWQGSRVFCATWLWEEEGVCCEEEPIRGEIK